MKYFLAAALATIVIFVALGIVRALSWRIALNAVTRRRRRGDTTCGLAVTWYGWRVKEYAECDQ